MKSWCGKWQEGDIQRGAIISIIWTINTEKNIFWIDWKLNTAEPFHNLGSEESGRYGEVGVYYNSMFSGVQPFSLTRAYVTYNQIYP